MSSRSKLLDDFNFKFDGLRKTELQNIRNQSFKELLQYKEKTISLFSDILKEFFARSKLSEDITTLFQQHTSISHKLSELKETLQLQKDEKQKIELEKQQTRNTLSFYEENLGLKIKLASSALIADEEAAVSFVFHHINESNFEETCSFTLVTNGIHYRVINCHPPVEEMEVLLKKLNITDDIHSFIVNIRKSFKKYSVV